MIVEANFTYKEICSANFDYARDVFYGMGS